MHDMSPAKIREIKELLSAYYSLESLSEVYGEHSGLKLAQKLKAKALKEWRAMTGEEAIAMKVWLFCCREVDRMDRERV